MVMRPNFETPAGQAAGDAGSEAVAMPPAAAPVAPAADLPFRDALATDSPGFIDIVEMGQQLWESLELVRWLETPQARWQGLSPLGMVAADRADEVLDLLETFELYS